MKQIPLPRRLSTPLQILRTAMGQFALLRDDPERFARNMMQVTHKALFRERLSDILHAIPMHVRIDPGLAGQPSLNVLSSGLAENGMTGGPNTILNLAFRIARLGVPVRLVTTVWKSTIEPAWFMRHVAQLIGDDTLPQVPIVTATDSAHPLVVGPNDIFMASHWTTVQQLKHILPSMSVQQFFYMLQEFEPGFYAWSSNYALAIETYDLNFWPVINEGLLADYLFSQPLGRLADPETHRRATVFEPAVETRLFHVPAQPQPSRPLRLLFYARPSNTRNMFGLGLAALRLAVTDTLFDDWEFLSIGGRGGVPALTLGGGHVLKPAPWMDYPAYARSLQNADLLLCPMLSPHTSYPVLEMVACGGVSVTNTFANKTRERLTKLSPDIVAAKPTLEGLSSALREAAGLIRARNQAGSPRTASLSMASDWASTLDPAAARVAGTFSALSGYQPLARHNRLPPC